MENYNLERRADSDPLVVQKSKPVEISERVSRIFPGFDKNGAKKLLKSECKVKQKKQLLIRCITTLSVCTEMDSVMMFIHRCGASPHRLYRKLDLLHEIFCEIELIANKN